MQLLAENCGELGERQPQSGDAQCHWKMVTGPLLERGVHTKEKIEFIAYYLATRPSERQILGRYGA
eukprot:15476871-Heterocapsa_arctica.AAC.1